MPSVLTPQLCQPPALSDVNVSAGGVAWPLPLRPQQATVPSVFRPQVCELPAPTDANLVAGSTRRGRVAWP